MAVLLTLSLFCPSLSATVLVVRTDQTPAALVQALGGLPCVSYEGVLSALEGVDMLLDASYEWLSTKRLVAVCEERQIVLIVLGPGRPVHPGKWTFYLGGNSADWTSPIAAVLQWLQVESANLLSDLSSFSLQLKQALEQTVPSVRWSSHFLSQQQSTPDLVGDVIRPFGNRVSVFTASAEATKSVLKAQYQMHIGGTGYANVLTEGSALFATESADTEANLYEGNLIVAREITYNARTASEFFSVLTAVLEPYLAADPIDLLSGLATAFPSHVLSSPYLLLNMQNGTRRVVGRFTQLGWEITAPITYLGGALSPPSTSKALIPLSGNFGGEVYEGYRYNTDSQTIGAVIALEEVNNRSDIIPNFSLDCWNFTGGIGPVSPAAYTSFLSRPDSFGTAILAGITSINAMSMLVLLRGNNLTMPVVGSATTSAGLASRSAFPNFLRTCIGDNVVNVATVQLIRRLGWTQIGLIVVDSPSTLSLQQDYLDLLRASNVSIVTTAVVSAATSIEEARANYTASFQSLIDTRCRILLLLAFDTYQYIPLVLYEMGIRKGDLVVVSRDLQIDYVTNNLTVTEMGQIAEVFYASLQLQPASFIGSIGKSLFQAISHSSGLSSVSNYACYYYDSAYTIAYALSWMLQSGRDFFNSSAMMSALRAVRFVGCTGFVYFDPYSNDREMVRFMVETTRYNESIGLFSEAIGVYDPAGTILFKLDSGFTWGDGTTNTPSNIRESLLGCPFEDRLVKDFPQGLEVFLGISLGLWVVTVGLAVAVYRRGQLEELRERREMEVGDVMVMVGVGVELIQLVALGPELPFLGLTLTKALDMSVGRIEGGFLQIWVPLESALVVWMLLSAACALVKCSPNSTFCTAIADFGFVVSHWLFVPVVSNLLIAFKCTHGTANIGEEVPFSSSFLDVDCYFPCWSSRHVAITVISVVNMTVFIGLCTWQRVKWQELAVLLNVKSGVEFLTLKSPLLLLLAVISQAYRNSFAVLHASLHLSILIFYLLTGLKWTTHWYQMVRNWQRLALLLCIWSTTVALCSLQVASLSPLPFPLVTLSGWAILLFLGTLYQLLRVKNLLYRPKGISTFYLFKFAFQRTTLELAQNLQVEFQKHSKKCVFKADILRPSTAAVDMITLKIQSSSVGN